LLPLSACDGEAFYKVICFIETKTCIGMILSTFL